MEDTFTKQYFLSVAAGKRLIAKAVVSMEEIKKALESHTVVVVSGTTNGYVAEELLKLTGQSGGFSKESFFRGINTGAGRKAIPGGFTGTDVVIEKGGWAKGKTIFDVASELSADDVVLKGANAVNTEQKLAGIQIGNPTLGTSAAVLRAAVGGRARLIIPVGLEKRVSGNIGEIAALLNAPSASGTRLLPVSGTIVTELEALERLSGAQARLVAAGGVLGAEGGCWLAVTGTETQLEKAEEAVRAVEAEPLF